MGRGVVGVRHEFVLRYVQLKPTSQDPVMPEKSSVASSRDGSRVSRPIFAAAI